MPHRIFLDHLRPTDTLVTITGDEADHARRVKRLGPGDTLTLMNGRGLIALAEVVEAKRDLSARVVEAREAPPLAPRLEVWGAPPKGPRLDDMIDALTQIGAALWRPLCTSRAVVDPREGKLARQERIIREACKQCGRAWLMEVGESATFAEALASAPGMHIVLAHADGEPPERSPTTAPAVRLLIGPEGGFSPDELARAGAAGADVRRFGPHAMRVETAACVATGVLLREARG